MTATATAVPRNATRAVGAMMGGLTLAKVIGVPVGSFVGQFTGWRGPFWALAALSALAAAFVGRFVPTGEQHAEMSVRAEVRALRQGRLWLALAAVLIMGGVLATYMYITPLLTDRAGIAESAVPLVLIAFGLGALGGTAIGGRLGDHRPMHDPHCSRGYRRPPAAHRPCAQRPAPTAAAARRKEADTSATSTP